MVNKKGEIDRKAEQERMTAKLQSNAPSSITKLVPDFRVTREWLAVGDVALKNRKYVAITCLITITNLGLPSGATDWHLIVSIKGEKPFRVNPTPVIGSLRLGTEYKNTVLSEKDLIYEKTLKPIATGEIINGYVLFWIDIEKEKLNSQGTTMEIVFSDVEGKQYSIFEDKFPVKETNYQIPYTPGVQFKEEPIKKATKK